MPNWQVFTIAYLRIVTESPLPSGVVDEPYGTTLEATGGTQPYTWSVASGSLPPGLSLDSTTGMISGVPTAAGTFSFTISVTDSSGGTATRDFGLAPPPPSGTAGGSYEVPIVITPPSTGGGGGGGTPTCSSYTVVAGTLPEGLTLDPATGLLSGTPVSGGQFTFTIGCSTSGGQTATKEFTITIYNPVPTLTSLSPNSAQAGGAGFSLGVRGDNFVRTSVVRWNGSDRPTTYVSRTELTAQIEATDIAAVGSASVTVFNPEPGGGTSNALPFTILEPNQPPTVDAGGPYDVGEGGSVPVSAQGSDPDGDTLTYEWDLDGDATFETEGAMVTFSTAGLDGPTARTVTVRVRDPRGLIAMDQSTVNIANVVPDVGDITAPTAPMAVNTSIKASALFSDAGVADTHTAQWDWGDGQVSAGSVTETDGSGSATGSHTYTSPGVYTIRLDVTDDDDGADQAFFRYVVVYAPDGGFVTGGGWITSPAGACRLTQACEGASGKASFGFVSKYQRGTTVPTGETEFQFKAGNLNFHSTSYEWLVVAGARAQFKGQGTINGSGSYRFMLTAIDGQVSGGGGTDKFRIKIWDITTGAIVYDNQMDAADNAEPTTVISGGSIVVHKS